MVAAVIWLVVALDPLSAPWCYGARGFNACRPPGRFWKARPRPAPARPPALTEYQRAMQTDASLRSLPGHLCSIVADERYDLAQKRALFFALWNDAAEPEDPRLGQAGAVARGIIEAYARHYFPAGSPYAYTDEDLQHFNVRRGRDPAFDPYDVGVNANANVNGR